MSLYAPFRCEGCGRLCDERDLTQRRSMPGRYCPHCGELEKCAACGELDQGTSVTFKTDAQNFICDRCVTEYIEVMEYIEPLPWLKRPCPGSVGENETVM